MLQKAPCSHCINQRHNLHCGHHEDPGRAGLCPLQVLDRLRNVAEAKGRRVACLLDTKGPEICTV